MITMKDVNDLTNDGLGGGKVESFGPEKSSAVVQAIDVLGTAICAEQGCTSAEVADLPESTPLGTRAEAAYHALKALLG